MSKKILLIGDLHLKDDIPGYIDAQINHISSYVLPKGIAPYTNLEAKTETLYDLVVFLGDVFDKRQPRPSVFLKFKYLIDGITMAGINVVILRGNHDSQNKSDDGVSLLNALYKVEHSEYDGTAFGYCVVASKPRNLGFHGAGIYLLPHYENQDFIRECLENNTKTHGNIVLGHFGFKGSHNSNGDNDSEIPVEDFRNPTYLGHIHHYRNTGNITVIGTPYSTSFQEAFKENFMGELEPTGVYPNRTFDFKAIPVSGGPRYLVYDLNELEKHQDVLNDETYFNILRVLVDPTREGNELEMIKDIRSKYKVKWVDIRYKQYINDKNKDSVSDFRPNRELHTINESIIEDYLNNNSIGIPPEELMKELKSIE